ncbi:MAG: hypothetical protein U0457_12470 [Candidatus Sericytochromatia bacterium]
MCSKKSKNSKSSEYNTSLNNVQGQSFLKIEKADRLDEAKNLNDDLENNYDTNDGYKSESSVKTEKSSSKNTGSLNKKNTGSLKNNNDYKIEDHSKDIFDDDGNEYEEEEKAITKKIRELQEKIDVIIDAITDKLAFIINKIKSIVFGVLDKVISPFTNIFDKIVDPILSRFRTKEKEEETEVQVEEEKKPKTAEETFEMSTFAKVSEMNIIFTNNHDVPMYKPKKDSFAGFTKSEENIIMDIALEAIKECAPFMEAQPEIEAGFYGGKKPFDVMINVTTQDILLFLGYVVAVPEMYTSQKWKISETFATWIVSGAPMVEKP